MIILFNPSFIWFIFFSYLKIRCSEIGVIIYNSNQLWLDILISESWVIGHVDRVDN